MRKIIYFILFALLMIEQICAAQDTRKPIEYRFKGGESGIIDFLGTNAKYPIRSLIDKSIGYSISSMTITPSGEPDKISIINSVDKSIDNEVIRLLKKTKNYWIQVDSIKQNQTFYFQIAFVITGNTSNAKVENPVKKNNFFVKPAVITAYAFDQTKIPIPDDTLFIQGMNLFNQGKFKEALPFINDLIKRNPFNKDLYQYRMRIYSKTNRKDLLDADLQKIRNFIPGTSLNDLQ